MIIWLQRIVVPVTLQTHAVETLHLGHHGICTMKSIAPLYCWLSGLDKDIERYAGQCQLCQTRLEKFVTTYGQICEGQPTQIVKFKNRDMIRVRDHETLGKGKRYGGATNEIDVGIQVKLSKRLDGGSYLIMTNWENRRRHVLDLRIREENMN
ncbi:hypothetical protein GJ496_009884 [Pomphorhynchus laevis]|nr:hypothetical protein GJ496_009884 [Pomphorhynchus laevis]